MDSRPDILGTPLGQFGLGALALVIGGALLFTLIGAVSSDDEDGTPTAAETTEAFDPGTDATGDTEAPTGSPTDGDGGTVTDGATAPADPGPTEGATDGATEATFAPGDITIQVLDAGGDGGTAHDAVVGCLEAAGYDSLIPNDASVVYDATTVFYTPGGDNQAMAQQVASAIGVGSVEEKPSNLSDTVPVHIVVGGDGDSIC